MTFEKRLPKGWIRTELENISTITLGRSPPSSTYNKERRGHPFFQGKADFGEIHPTARVWCDASKTIAEKNDILISVRAPVGSTNISTETCGIGRGLSSIKTLKIADMLYVFYHLRHLENYISQMGTGTTFKAITGGQLRTIKISLSPHAEQLRIVAKIESIFAQIDACKERLEKWQGKMQSGQASLSALKNSVLKQAFEGKLVQQNSGDESAEVFLKKIHKNSKKHFVFEKNNLPTGWINFQYNQYLRLEYGCGLSKTSRNSEGKFPVYGSGGIVDFCDKFLIEDPCLVIGRKGAAGKVYLVTTPSWPIDTTYYVNKFPMFEQKFLYFLFQQLNLPELDSSTAIPSLRRDDVYSLYMIMPPLAEQKRIVTKIESIFARIDAMDKYIKSSLELLDTLKRSVLKQAFEGKLVPQDPNDEPTSVLLQRIKEEKLPIPKSSGRKKNVK